MAVIRRPGARRGLSAGGATVSRAKVSYTVVKEIKNAMKIAGKRRQKGDVFEAIPRHVHFLLLEGVIVETATLTAAATSASASSSSSSSSSSSASDATSASSSSASSSSTSTSTKAAKASS